MLLYIMWFWVKFWREFMEGNFSGKFWREIMWKVGVKEDKCANTRLGQMYECAN